MQNNYAFWHQTRQYTCGAAALMVALYELGCMELSESNEIKIWNRVHPMFYMGSMPAYLAMYAAQSGVHSEIYSSPQKISILLRHLPQPYRFLYSLLLLINRWSLRKAQRQNIKIHHFSHQENDLSMMVDMVLAEEDVRILSVIQVHQYNLHYILLRREQDENIIVMDPGYGTNMIFNRQKLMESYENLQIGFYVVLTKNSGTIDTSKPSALISIDTNEIPEQLANWIRPGQFRWAIFDRKQRKIFCGPSDVHIHITVADKAGLLSNHPAYYRPGSNILGGFVACSMDGFYYFDPFSGTFPGTNEGFAEAEMAMAEICKRLKLPFKRYEHIPEKLRAKKLVK